MDISQKTVQELKALAYDVLAMLEKCQADLKIINQEISKRVATEPAAIQSTEMTETGEKTDPGLEPAA
jgi:hypothetical protein